MRTIQEEIERSKRKSRTRYIIYFSILALTILASLFLFKDVKKEINTNGERIKEYNDSINLIQQKILYKDSLFHVQEAQTAEIIDRYEKQIQNSSEELAYVRKQQEKSREIHQKDSLVTISMAMVESTPRTKVNVVAYNGKSKYLKKTVSTLEKAGYDVTVMPFWNVSATYQGTQPILYVTDEDAYSRSKEVYTELRGIFGSKLSIEKGSSPFSKGEKNTPIYLHLN